jgi:hypothetical protein
MNSKKLITMVLLGLLTLAAAGIAQAQTESAIAVGRSDLQADRQAVVAANLPMTEAESAAFWPVYRAYRTEVAAIGDKMVVLITTYAKAYNEKALTDEQGLALTKDALKLKKDAIALKESYLSKFSKVLPGKSVAAFYQIENKLDAAVDVAIAAEIPLVEVE